MNLLFEIRQRFQSILEQLAPDPSKVSDYLSMIKPAQNPEHGDYQANFAMSLAKLLKKKPPVVAEEVIARLGQNDLFETPTVAGPGFINLRLKKEWLAKQVQVMAGDERLGIAPTVQPKTFVIDYSAPNVAKPLHVGHIRSTIIGEALCRILRFLGHKVIGDNHLGDWGTQFGMLLYGFKNFRDDAAFKADPVRELARLYRHVRELAKANDDDEAEKGNPVADAYRAETVKLHEGDPENVALWKLFMPYCLTETEAIYKRLDVHFTCQHGESFYQPMLADVVESLLEKGIAERSEGAVIIRMVNEELMKEIDDQIIEIRDRMARDDKGAGLKTGLLPTIPDGKISSDTTVEAAKKRIELGELLLERFRRNIENEEFRKQLGWTEKQLREFMKKFEQQMAQLEKLLDRVSLIQKRDGAYTYTTSDLATIKYRVDTWNPDAMLYVVDFRQADHFRNFFAAAKRWGYDKVELTHVSFGSIMGADKRPFQTRAGGVVELDALLDEAIALGAKKYLESYQERLDRGEDVPTLGDEEKKQIAEAVGIGAVKYADLSQNRTSDYVFSFDKMLATDGNTATYMQYAYARCRSIFRKGEIDAERFRTNPPPLTLGTPFERALALQILRWSEALDAAAAEYMPHYLTGYLWDLSKAYSSFFVNCPVLKAETAELRDSRLLLCDLTARIIKQTLELLGIRTVERM
jgi:arginyl-tRNA synthetase